MDDLDRTLWLDAVAKKRSKYPNAKRFLVTGCARSGTRFIFRLLNDLGFPCGHEWVFNPHKRLGFFWGEVSWLGVPYIKQLEDEVVLVHQVRHPLSVARSVLGIRMFTDRVAHGPFIDFLRHHSSVYDETNLLSRFMRYWVEWNTRIELAAPGREYLRYRIEDLQPESLVRFLGGEVERGKISAIFRKADRMENHRERDVSITMDSFPEGPLKTEFLALAESYGYDIRSVA